MTSNSENPKKERTEAQKAAARANGARSRGPATAQGKQRSSRNARKDGLLAHVLTVSEEEAEILLSLESDFSRRFNPRDTLEFHSVEELPITSTRCGKRG